MHNMLDCVFLILDMCVKAAQTVWYGNRQFFITNSPPDVPVITLFNFCTSYSNTPERKDPVWDSDH